MKIDRLETAKPIRVLLFAPSHEILGGQTVQGQRLLKLIGETRGVEIALQPINPKFPGALLWVKNIPGVRTVLTILLYLPQVFSRVPRADILHIFTAGFYSYTLWTIPALIAGKLFGKKTIVNYRDGQGEQHLQQHWTAKPTLRWASAVVSPSAFIVDAFARYGIPARVIYNVIDSNDFLYRKRSQLRPLLMTNRGLEPLYNIECILRAFKRVLERYPEATLTIAHDGPARAALEKYAADLGLHDYQFIGRVPHAEVRELYDRADIYVTTPNIDCMPGSVLECFASGLPVVATKAGGIPFLVTNEETGLLADLNDDEAVARNIVRLLEDPALVERITGNARAELERYRGDVVRDAWMALYRELLHR